MERRNALGFECWKDALKSHLAVWKSDLNQLLHEIAIFTWDYVSFLILSLLTLVLTHLSVVKTQHSRSKESYKEASHNSLRQVKMKSPICRTLP